ncbi:NAD-dependent epimerase/dehydratase family protein [Agrococcus sediminis]|uniref:NAD-dependent epimerase/dehydratase family protein n=1 Tax=Agrococcus sediminis TaxID=2599924 RepID=A0A5M8QKU1_9MICO|nr:NAD-dependent epimerase/dehydratase family protein [Agrococcus sediminis]KAA6434892.1 NAD-dependent epimerase/dehydratase family protein [Agrococcus sediminis]
MSLRIAITGADGFVGRHVARLAAERGHRVVGVLRSERREPPPDLDEAVVADLAHAASALPPVDVVLHLAGLAAVGPSFAQPQRYLEQNSAMVTHLAESLLQADERPRLIGASSGAVYAPGEGPLDERAPTACASPYVVSKLLVELQLDYYRGRGLETIAVRPFNHLGPGQGEGFLLPDLAAGLRRLRPGEALPVGDLTTRRDYTDVRDVAAAYLALCEAPVLEHPLYNVASGIARSGEEVLAALCAALGVPMPPRVRIAGERRPVDAQEVVGDAGRLRDELGWRPRIGLAETVRDFAAQGMRAATL